MPVRTLALLPVTLSALLAEPEFIPESGVEAHPIVAAVKIVGMLATAIFVIVMVIKSIKVIKHDEDDQVHLPD